jgi:hypothetical protein
MSTSRRRLVAVLLVVGVGALAGAFGAQGAGSQVATGEQPAPSEQPSIAAPVLGVPDPAVLRDPGTTGDRLGRVLRPAAATAVVAALVSALFAIWCAVNAPRWDLRSVVARRAAPRGPPLPLA